MNLPIYEISVVDPKKSKKQFFGKQVEVGIALVSEPAIEENFIFFSKDEPAKMTFNDEKMMVKGPAIIPNKLIYRNDSLGERYVFFTEKSIFDFVELLMNKDKNKFNELHTDNYIKANIIESYFASEPNEFNVPKGSWIVSAKINDPVTWSKIKNGDLKAFSVEGLFSSMLVDYTLRLNDEKTKTSMNDLKEKLMNAINSVLFNVEPEKPETDKVEEFEMVDTQDVTTKVEEKIDAAETAVEASSDEALTIETVKALLEELKSSIVADFNAKVADVQEQMSKVDEKVLEFSKQPISQSIVEEVANPTASTEYKAAKYFRK